MIETTTVTIPAVKPWLTYDAPRWLRKVEYFIRVKILRQPRYLIDKWTIEEVQDTECLHSISLEKELIEALTKEINLGG